ncbi:hypothetical protein GCM10011611_09860 [Aliidongia dinghuensis]|uniref:Uncharacterized protein n=1 Tax=Aliidongia dinghuensis TaxID=1867774 RepID=A0A8J3E229_9PROT|nr:hypothetical protein GCM10011611_09860 [Aliidongia dinghuensis]
MPGQSETGVAEPPLAGRSAAFDEGGVAWGGMREIPFPAKISMQRSFDPARAGIEIGRIGSVRASCGVAGRDVPHKAI